MSTATSLREFAFMNAHERNKAYPSPPQVAPVTWFKRLPGAPLLPLSTSTSTRPLPEIGAGSRTGRYADAIATLCFYTLGLLRREVDGPYAFHRGIPSPRCFHPTELYVWVPQGSTAGAAIPCGLYHYAPLGHALEQVRGPEAAPWLATALGLALPLHDVIGLVTADFWRMAHRYADFALRLTTLEAGHAAENLALLGEALGWQPEVRGFYHDQTVGRLLGIDLVQEGLLAVVRLRHPAGTSAVAALATHTAAPLASDPAALAPLSLTWRHTSGIDQLPTCGGLRELEAAAMRVTAPLLPPARVTPPAPADGAAASCRRLPLPPASAHPVGDVRTLLLARNSGQEYEGLMSRPASISLETLAALLRCGSTTTAGNASDWHQLMPQPYLVVGALHVDGLRPGLYRYDPAAHDLGVLYDEPDSLQWLGRRLIHTNGIKADSLACQIFVVAPTDAIARAAGARAYRVLNLSAGAALQRLGLAAAEHGLFCRPNLTYDTVQVERLLGLTGTDHLVLYQAIFGRNVAHGWHYDLSL